MADPDQPRRGQQLPTGLWPPGGPSPAAVGVAVGLLVVLVGLTASWLGASGARRDLRTAEQRAALAETQAADLQRQLADLRSQLQGRQGSIDDLTEEVETLRSELAVAQDAQAAALIAAEQAADEQASASEEAATATTLARVTTAIASNPDIVGAVHVTDVVDATTLVGFDLREMLADGPGAGQAVQLTLAVTDAPAPGDCRHTQSVSLATAWLAAADDDVLLRRPAGAPATDALGRQLVEVVAFANPASSLNVTLAVAGEAIIDEDEVDGFPGLAERLRVAQASAQAQGSGVWGCTDSDLLRGDVAEPTPTPTPSGAVPSPSPPAEDG